MPAATQDEFTAPRLSSSQPSVLSRDGIYLATVFGTTLMIRKTDGLETVRIVDLAVSNNKQEPKFLCLRWSPSHNSPSSRPVSHDTPTPLRFLYATEDYVRVFDLQDQKYLVNIDNGSGSMGKNAHVEFGANMDEVLIWSSFSSRLVVWNIATGKSIEIKDPKHVGKGHDRRGGNKTSIFALITRHTSHDIVNLHIQGSYTITKSIALPTIDAQGLKWSPDGRWLAVWDSPRMGYKVLIYTADGNLLRTYSGDYFDDALIGLGVRCIEWSISGDFLAVAGYERAITLLNTRTFSPAMHLKHPSNVRHPSTTLWQELVDLKHRSYAKAGQPFALPVCPSEDKNDSGRTLGTSIVTFSADGSFLATRDDSMPTVVFIWDLGAMNLCTVLLQHAAVRCLAWHPHKPEKLLIQCGHEEGILYTWDAKEDRPSVLVLPGLSFGPRAEVRWIDNGNEDEDTIMVGDAQGCVVVAPEGKSQLSLSLNDNSSFSLSSGPAEGARSTEFDNTATHATLNDTFQFRQDMGVY